MSEEKTISEVQAMSTGHRQEFTNNTEFTQFDQFNNAVDGLLSHLLENEPDSNKLKESVVKYLKGVKGLVQVFQLPASAQTAATISRLVNEQATRLDPIPNVLVAVDESGVKVDDIKVAADLVPPTQVKASA